MVVVFGDVTIRPARPDEKPGWVRWLCNGVYHFVTRTVNTAYFLYKKRYLQEVFKDCTKAPIINFRTWLVDMHGTSNPKIVEKFFEIHRNGERLFSSNGPRKQAFVYLMEVVFPKLGATHNDSILTCDEQHSTKLRGLVHHAFTPDRVKEHGAQIQSITVETLRRWCADGKIDLQHQTRAHAAEIIGKIFLGFEGPYDIIAKAVTDSLIPYMMRAGWKQGKVAPTAEEQKGIDIAIKTVESIFANANDPTKPESFVKYMKKLGCSDAEIKSMIFALLIGGQDTSANLINYILLKLAQDSQLQRNVRGSDERIRHVIFEGLRMMTPASAIARVAGEDMIVSYDNVNHYITQGSLVFAAPTFAGRNSDVVNSPNLDTFNPARWEKLTIPPSFASVTWFALGGGKHKCPGFNLADYEITTFVKTLLQSYVLSTDIAGEPKQVTMLTTRLEGPLPISIRPIRESD